MRPIHHRTLAGLGMAQIVGGAGMAAAIVAGGLLGRDLLGHESLAGLPMALALTGTTLAAIPLARHMRRCGRRAGLASAWLLGAGGAALVAVAAIAELPAVFLVGMLLFGWSAAAGDAARFAAADLALPRARGTSIGLVLTAAAVSGLVGPTLVGPAAAVARSANLPDLAGPFLLSAAGFSAAALVLTLLLRPDPLVALGAVSHVPRPPAGIPKPRESWLAPLRSPAARVAVASASLANLVMVAVMTVIPLHLVSHGQHLGTVGLLLSVHLAGMFGPSPLSGWLCDRLGSRTTIALGGIVMATAAVTAAVNGPGEQLPALFFLGVGWNLAHVASSTMLTESTPADSRISAQGLTDTSRGLAAMIGAAVSGPVLAAGGFAAVALLGALLSAALVVLAARTLRPGPAGPRP